MSKVLSVDLRQRVVDAVHAGPDLGGSGESSARGDGLSPLAQH